MADLSAPLQGLLLSGQAADARLLAAITGFPTLTRTIDGASTLEVVVADYTRTLLRSGILSTRSWASVEGVGYELVSVAKSGDTLTLTFEDSLVAALRRRTDPKAWAAGAATRAQIITDLAAELPTRAQVDPAARGVVNAATQRSAAGQEPSDSWALLGTLASDAGWRRFSDGTSIIAGSDEWLASRYEPTTVREYTGAVQTVDFSYDVAQATSTATLSVDADAWALPVGAPVILPDLGPGSGAWLVSKVTRTLTQLRGSVDLIRATPALPEAPPPDPTPAGDSASGLDKGEGDFLPTPAPTQGGATNAADTGARGRFVAAALSKKGLPYIWGGTGPKGYDCSGLVQFAARAAGKPISRVVSTQWNDAGRSGQRISVDQAIKTRGAVLTRLGGYGDHTAISLGDGTTIEARGKAYPIGSYPASRSRGWTGGYLWV